MAVPKAERQTEMQTPKPKLKTRIRAFVGGWYPQGPQGGSVPPRTANECAGSLLRAARRAERSLSCPPLSLVVLMFAPVR